MPTFCVNTQAQPGTNDHEVHDTTIRRDCHPSTYNQHDLGWHPDCASAVQAAKRIYPYSNGCFYCARGCHTT